MTEHSNGNGKHPAPVKGGLIEWFAYNHVAANILMLLFVVGGLIGVASMRTETFPSIDPRIINVTVVYPGATPYEVADGITNRVEEQLNGIEGIKRVVSTASEGAGIIRVELLDFADGDDVYNEVETAVNGLQDFPPDDAERPIITRVKVTPKVMTLAMHGNTDESTLKHWAERIEDELRQLPGVALTSLRGVRDYQISIEVSENTLREYGLSLQDVQQATQAFSVDIPAGSIESERGDILLRVQDKRKTGEAFDEIVLKTLPDGSTLKLGDIANVIDGFADNNLISLFNGERAAFIDVNRSESEDTLEVADTVMQYLNEIKLPAGINLTLQDDKTVALQERMSLMLQNAMLGFMLVFLILLLFLDLKLAFWTSIAIPISFLGGLMIIYGLGYSVNMISLFALIVVLGVVVDDAIVIGESVFDSQEKRPDDPHALYKGVRLVAAPVTVGILTTIFAFAPLIFSTGTMGQIISVIPVVVIAILAVSLAEAFLILPAHLSNPKRWSVGTLAKLRGRFSHGLSRFVERYVLPAANTCIRWRYATFAAFIGVLIITVSMVSSGTIRFLFFPAVEGDEVTVTVTMPEGTPFDVTEATMMEVAAAAKAVEDELENADKKVVQSTLLSIGQTSSDASPGSSGAESTSNTLGQLKLQLVSSDLRESSASEIEGMIRDRLTTLTNVEKIEYQSSLIGEEADIEIELSHHDDDALIQAADFLKSQIEAVEGTKETSSSHEQGKREYIFELTQEGLAVGLTPAELGRQLRGAFFGLEVQRFQRGRSEVVVYVRYPESERDNLGTLQQMRIRLPDGSEAPLESVAQIRKQFGFSNIKTVNGQRVISVLSDVDYATTTPNEVLERLRSVELPELEAKYPDLHYSFEGETRENREDMQNLLRNLSIALLLIYVLLGAQLRSYIQPIIIMSAIPFGIVGAVWGHFLLGYDLTFISMFGIVALTGVVINDSVVLVDYLNRQIREGHNATRSALSAIKRRFRPILLTTLTTSLGLLPILLETSLQAQFLIPMVVSLAMGIVFSTTIILLLIPCLIVILDDVDRKLTGKSLSQQMVDDSKQQDALS